MSNTIAHPHPHEARPELPHVHIKAGESPVETIVLLNGEPVRGLKKLSFTVDAEGALNVLTLTLSANVTVDAALLPFIESKG